MKKWKFWKKKKLIEQQGTLFEITNEISPIKQSAACPDGPSANHDKEPTTTKSSLFQPSLSDLGIEARITSNNRKYILQPNSFKWHCDYI